MECKICRNTLLEGTERCNYCGAKVVKSNYGNGQDTTNVLGEITQPTSNPVEVTQNQINNVSPIQPIPVIGGQEASGTPQNTITANQINSNNYQQELKTVYQSTQTQAQPVNIAGTNQNTNINSGIPNSPQEPKPNIPTTSITNNQNIEEDLAEHYLGEKYQKFRKMKFSFSTFFFGGFYMCYRKQYVNAVVLFAASFVASSLYNVINSIIPFIVLLVVYIYYSIKFSKMYLETVNKKIKKDIEQFNGSNYETLRKQLLRESSTSTLSLFVALLVFIVIGVVISVGMIVKGVGDFFTEAESSPSTTISPVNPSNNKNTIGSREHGYIKVTDDSWIATSSLDSEIVTYKSDDGTVRVEFAISDKSTVEEATEAKQNSLGGNTLSVPEGDNFVISNYNGNISSEILVKKMKDGKVHIITISTTTLDYDCFNLLEQYYM